MKNKTKKTNKFEKIIETVLKDRSVRLHTVQKKLEYFFPIYFHHYIKYETAPFHKEMFKVLENDTIKLAVICAFRGSAKSTIITTAYVLWTILGFQQRKFIVICGQTEQKARQYLMNIKKELQENDLLKKDLGPFEEERNSLGNATALIIKRMNVKIMISSVEQSIRGMRHGQHRPDLIILDDIEDINSVKTREGRDKAFNWLTSEVIPAGSERTRFIIAGNLLHEDSVIRRLQQNIDSGNMRSLNAVSRQYSIRDEQGNSLWPGKYPTPESIQAEKDKMIDDEAAWYREYELKIISTADQVVRPEWIQTYSQLPRDKTLTGVAIGIDLAISDKNTADYTAIVVGYIYGYKRNMEIHVQSYPLNERIPFPEQVEYIKSLVATHEKYSSRVKIYIESIGYQGALVQLLERKKFNVIGVPVRGDKKSRLQLTTPLLRDGKILFPEKGCEELLGQLVGFGKEKHDDLVDAFSIMTLKAIEDCPGGCSFGLGRGDAI